MLPRPGALSAAAGPRDVPRAPRAAGETRGGLVSCSHVPPTRCVQLRSEGRGYQLMPRFQGRDRSSRGDVPGTHGPCCAGICWRRDRSRRSRVGQVRLPRLHLLRTAFLSTPLRSQVFPSPYPRQKLIPSSPSITKKGMDVENGAPGPRREQPPPCGGPYAPSSARRRGPGPVTNNR